MGGVVNQFQFPSNGKVLSDTEEAVVAETIDDLMFQFPSNGKVLSDEALPGILEASNTAGFNSLQTGKSFRTKKIRTD